MDAPNSRGIFDFDGFEGAFDSFCHPSGCWFAVRFPVIGMSDITRGLILEKIGASRHPAKCRPFLVILSGAMSPDDVQAVTRLGVTGFIAGPVLVADARRVRFQARHVTVETTNSIITIDRSGLRTQFIVRRTAD